MLWYMLQAKVDVGFCYLSFLLRGYISVNLMIGERVDEVGEFKTLNLILWYHSQV